MLCYQHFILDKGRSQGFASTSTDWIALLRLAFAPAPNFIVINLANEE